MVPFRGRHTESSHPVLSILCHPNPPHVLLHLIHELTLCSFSFPPAWQLHLRHPLSNIPTISALSLDLWLQDDQPELAPSILVKNLEVWHLSFCYPHYTSQRVSLLPCKPSILLTLLAFCQKHLYEISFIFFIFSDHR